MQHENEPKASPVCRARRVVGESQANMQVSRLRSPVLRNRASDKHFKVLMNMESDLRVGL